MTSTTYISLESVNYPNRFIRHRNFLGELTPIQSELDKEDATFNRNGNWRYGVEGELQSVNRQTNCLRHQNFRVKLHAVPHPFGRPPTPEEMLIILDSTFIMEPGLTDPADKSLVSFRSKNFPERFIRHRNFQLWVEPADSQLAKQDATFRLRYKPFVPPPPGPK